MDILIADDDPVTSRLLQATLDRGGHRVIAVSNGEDARATLLRPDGPRLAILDWMMPGLDGPAVCREVRRQLDPYVYVILLTARNQREDMVDGFAAGVDDFLTKPFDAAELEARLRSGARILELQSRLLAAQETLRHDATHDRLTGLWNRGWIVDELRREFLQADTRPFSIALVDIDRFKEINDLHGHLVGDDVLREVAIRMTQTLRGGTIGRYGGEEFLIVLADCSDESAAVVGDRLRAAVCAMPVTAAGFQRTVTVSVGVAMPSVYTPDSQSMIRLADEALYRAKARGRNCVELGRATTPLPATWVSTAAPALTGGRPC